MNQASPLDYQQVIPEVIHAMGEVHAPLDALGLDLVPPEGHRLPQLNCVRIPEGVDDLTARKRLLEDWNIEIGGGLGSLKGRAWRIGLMGHSCRFENVTLLLSALETCLRDQGHKFPAASAVEAASTTHMAS